MPYDASNVSSLPDYVQKLSAKRRRQWADVWNSAYKRCTDNGGDKTKCESSAFAQANGVVGAKVSLSTSETATPVSVATFALDLEPYDAGDVVYRPGLLFKAGDYPDKDFSMTPAELRAAVDSFNTPVQVDLEHIATPLSGKLGEVVHVEASDDGQELHGIVALPKWLDGVLDERKVSATWDRATKQLAGLALVLNPRVDEAALMAAFSAAGGGAMRNASFAEWDTAYVNDLPDSNFLFIESGGDKDGEGRTTPRAKRHFPYKDKSGKIDLPHLRNAIARIPQSDAHGLDKDAVQKRARALLDKANASMDDLPGEVADALIAAFATRHDTPEGQYVMQSLHDMAARYGAVCKASNANMASSHEAAAVQKVHDLTADNGAKCATTKNGSRYPMFTRREGSPMANAWEWLKGKLEGEPAPEETTTAGTATMSATEKAEFESLKAEQARLKDENRRIRQERIADQAAAFADQQIRASRAFPAEREAIIADYVQRASDDLVLEPRTVTFTDKDGKQQTRKVTGVDLLEAAFAARPQHGLTKEELETRGLEVLMNRSETESASQPKPADEKRVSALVGMTALGRTVASQKNGKN